MSLTLNQENKEPENFLTNKKVPQKKSSEFYEKQKLKKLQFGQVWGEESHLRRRRYILEQHPEIAKLSIPNKPHTLILAFVLVPLNLWFSYSIIEYSWFIKFICLYVVTGTINHTLHVIIHDLTHLLGHQNVLINKAVAIFCNLSTGIPSAISFGRYHSDHHNYMGIKNQDTDLPCQYEVQFCKNKVLKFIYFLFMTPVYALRPFVCMHKQMSLAQKINFVVIISFDLLVLKFLGFQALLYLLLGIFFSIGAHPASAHVIAQHYQFVKGLETYDYLGFWNIFNLNVGYHIEHHDFPNVPWYNLPKIRSTAPEWYEDIPYHTSYLKVIWKFICDDNFNLNNRTLRFPEKKCE